jgi:hypothetical protein
MGAGRKAAKSTQLKHTTQAGRTNDAKASIPVAMSISALLPNTCSNMSVPKFEHKRPVSLRLRRNLDSGTPRAFSAVPPTCRPSHLSVLGRRVLSPRRLIEYRLVEAWLPSRVANSVSSPVFARAGATIGRCPPHAHACQVGGLGCRHRRRQVVRDPSCFQGSARTPFFFSMFSMFSMFSIVQYCSVLFSIVQYCSVLYQ